MCRVWCSGRPTHENRSHKGTYKREGNILKISGDQSFTLTMEGDIPEPPPAGFTAPYTSSIGTTGTMTIVSVG